MALPILTAEDCVKAGINCPGQNTGATIANFIFKIIEPALTIAFIICVAALVYGGAMYIMSTGDENEARKAKLIVIYALLGLIVIGVAGIAVNAVIGRPVPIPPRMPIIEILEP